MNNQPHEYLKRIGVTTDKVTIGKNAAKAESVLVRAHERRMPSGFAKQPANGDRDGWQTRRTTTPTGGPSGEGWAPSTGARPAETKSAAVDPPCTAKRVGASGANIEGNESAKYDKLEKRSLKGLKGGGTEKELRDGHNSRGKMAKSKMEKTMGEYAQGTLHSGSKTGPKVTNRKQAIAIGISQAKKAK